MAPQPRTTSDDEALVSAYQLIGSVPDLAVVVASRVRGLGVIASAGPDYDSSHSEPQWPEWIFVSIPPPGRLQASRLAEGVVHEAMHHQLGTLEQQLPMISTEAPLFSPWKRQQRLASGVLHGLYVFTCLTAFFRRIEALQRGGEDYARRRVMIIREEFAELDRPGLEAALTKAGRRLVAALYSEAFGA